MSRIVLKLGGRVAATGGERSRCATRATRSWWCTAQARRSPRRWSGAGSCRVRGRPPRDDAGGARDRAGLVRRGERRGLRRDRAERRDAVRRRDRTAGAQVEALGLVGRPAPSAPAGLEALAAGRVPVVAPLAPTGPLNVNADEAAAALAVGLGAERILFLTDSRASSWTTPSSSASAPTTPTGCSAGSFEGGIVPKLRPPSLQRAAVSRRDRRHGGERMTRPSQSGLRAARLGSADLCARRHHARARRGLPGLGRRRPRYLDFVAGIAVVSLGHCAPGARAAAQAQLDRLWHVSNLYWTEPMLQLAGLLAERFPGGRAFFCNSGAEANEAALKIARKATGRTRIVALEGGFHGRTLGALRRPASRRNGRASGRCSPASLSRARTTSSRSRRRSRPQAIPRSCCSSPCSGRAE